jgi:hypothetical protein
MRDPASPTLPEAAGGLQYLDPVQTILQSDAEKVRTESRACIEMLDARNFILGTGCFVPRDAPISNLKAMTDVAHAYTPKPMPAGRCSASLL